MKKGKKDRIVLCAVAGIFYATSVLGPAMGFLLGAFFLSKYTDITLDSSQLGISSTSNTWVGAWWLGFLGASVTTFLSAFPMASFPRFLPTAQQRAKDLSELQKKKATQTQTAEAPKNAEPALAAPDGQVYPNPDAEPASGARSGKGSRRSSEDKALQEGQVAPVSQNAGALSPDQSERSLLNHVKRLMLNPTFVFLTLAAAAETMIASGLTGFATKIFIAMFGISSTRASSLLGMVAVPSACGGTLLGGYVITKLNVSSATIVRYCAILALVPWFTLFVFLQSCPSKYNALVNLTTTADTQKLTFRDLERACNIRCNCSGAVYDPVCGTDNLTYYSPCLAGCADVRRVKKTKVHMEVSMVLKVYPDDGPRTTTDRAGDRSRGLDYAWLCPWQHPHGGPEEQAAARPGRDTLDPAAPRARCGALLPRVLFFFICTYCSPIGGLLQKWASTVVNKK
ncbi:solute carrier organic anion transporter family member 4A1-like isoform X2 [Dermacentor andersoni]|uniref:solute carrier organic anion transporter family member 4A1-like isoform X2 n=1 Tax=Dermacentor andersoni TaxID=34620 RepID=UPI002415A95A|nr:solute carrier organic anion transporter family member 4A1-like isoform X2 [Dermacentor andersoni]